MSFLCWLNERKIKFVHAQKKKKYGWTNTDWNVTAASAAVRIIVHLQLKKKKDISQEVVNGVTHYTSGTGQNSHTL